MQSHRPAVSDSIAAPIAAPTAPPQGQDTPETRYCAYIECGKPLDPAMYPVTYVAQTGETKIHPGNTAAKRYCNARCRVSNYWYLNANHPNAPRRIHEQRLADDKLFLATA